MPVTAATLQAFGFEHGALFDVHFDEPDGIFVGNGIREIFWIETELCEWPDRIETPAAVFVAEHGLIEAGRPLRGFR